MKKMEQIFYASCMFLYVSLIYRYNVPLVYLNQYLSPEIVLLHIPVIIISYLCSSYDINSRTISIKLIRIHALYRKFNLKLITPRIWGRNTFVIELQIYYVITLALIKLLLKLHVIEIYYAFY